MPRHTRPERASMMKPIRIQKGLAKVGIYHVINRDEWLHFQVIWREAGKLHRKQFPTLPEAKEYAEEQAQRLADGGGLLVPVPRKEIAKYRSLENMLGGQSLEEFVKQHLGKKASGKSTDVWVVVDQYLKENPANKDLLSKFADYFQSVPFDTIVAIDLEKFLKDQAWLGNEERLKAIQALEEFMAWAKKNKYLPAGSRTAAEEAKKDELMEAPNVMNPGELVTLLKNVPERDLPVIALSAYTGLTLQELSRLRWDDIDWKAQTIDLGVLGKKEPVYLNAGILKLLRKYRKPSGPLKEDLSTQNLKQVARRSGITQWQPRMLSRSYRIYEKLLQNPNAEDVTGVNPADAEKWFQVFNDLV